MDRRRYHPQFEVLEDRALPSTLLTPAPRLGAGVAGAHAHHQTADAKPHVAIVRAAAKNNPGVAPVNSTPFGASYREWAARWEQYALSIRTPKSPFFDKTGAHFAVGQSGPVWYLSGVIVFSPDSNTPPPSPSNPAKAVRHVTLPEGKALFFPVLNSETDNLVPGGPNLKFTVKQLRGFARANMNAAEHLKVQIDGVSIHDLSQYRVTSPVFSYKLPANNILSLLTGIQVPAQRVHPAVNDGVYLMVQPLAVGHHTIHFSGDFGPGNFALNVTYHITVTPGHGS